MAPVEVTCTIHKATKSRQGRVVSTPSISLFPHPFNIIFTLLLITTLRLLQLDPRILQIQDRHWRSRPAFTGTPSTTYVRDDTGTHKKTHNKYNSLLPTATVNPKFAGKEMVLTIPVAELVSIWLAKQDLKHATAMLDGHRISSRCICPPRFLVAFFGCRYSVPALITATPKFAVNEMALIVPGIELSSFWLVIHALKRAAIVSVRSCFRGSSTCRPEILTSTFFVSGYSANAFIPCHLSIPYRLQQQLSSTLHSLPFQRSYSTLHLGLLLSTSAPQLFTDTHPMVLCPSQHNHYVLYTARWRSLLIYPLNLEVKLFNQPLQHGIFPALTAWYNQPLQHGTTSLYSMV
jgi:hypothetical protein